MSEVCELYQPQTISASEFKEDGAYKVFGANGAIGFYDKYNHENAEVLITCRGATCGTINLSEPKSWITGNAMVAKPIDGRVNKHFLYDLLKTTDLSSVITGAAQPQITRASLSPFKIPLPPVSIQEEIVTKIKNFEKIISGAKQVLENFKPQIDINSEWEMVALGEHCKIRGGNAFKSTDYVDEGVQLIRMGNVKQMYFDNDRPINENLDPIERLERSDAKSRHNNKSSR